MSYLLKSSHEELIQELRRSKEFIDLSDEISHEGLRESGMRSVNISQIYPTR